MESTLDEDIVMTIEMTTKDLDYHINLVGKEAAGFKRIGSSFESSVGKILSNSTVHTTEKSFMKGGLGQRDKLHCCLKKVPQPLQPSTATVEISQRP